MDQRLPFLDGEFQRIANDLRQVVEQFVSSMIASTTNLNSCIKHLSNLDVCCSEHGASPKAVGQAAHILLERDTAEGIENEIAIEDMVLIVSRDIKWDGISMPKPKYSKTTTIRNLESWQKTGQRGTIMSWLRSQQVRYNPDREDIYLLCPNEYNNVVAKNEH
ncbi:hypothetical protein ACJQWK_07107 [Exserohilum turcicum]|uniref:Uncharacterized protein n=1 Tax=Exserohilum turcicum (strain 28A) TaxID=671987 RepID=R0IIP4_EXST2|nr:uncharacterized protein SETTUDRAFT_32050 [Exserohilum turcica Et28A]EOA84811.1 hypothetical protein SETTUDRAFT_32050 [Exserohilum turcica Et28A]